MDDLVAAVEESSFDSLPYCKSCTFGMAALGTAGVSGDDDIALER